MNRRFVLLACLMVAVLAASVSASASSASSASSHSVAGSVSSSSSRSGSASGSASGSGSGSGSAPGSVSASDSLIPSVPGVAAPMVPPQGVTTVPSAGTGPFAANPYINVTSTGAKITILVTIGNWKGTIVTDVTFGNPATCRTTECQAIRASFAASAGVDVSQVTFSAVTSSKKFYAQALNVNLIITTASQAAAVNAFNNLVANAADGILPNGVAAAVPVPSAPSVNASAGVTQTFNVVLGNITLAAFTSQQSAYAPGINALPGFQSATVTVPSGGVTATTITSAKKFTSTATVQGVQVRTIIHDPTSTTITQLNNKFSTAVTDNTKKIANFNVVTITPVTSTPSAAVWSCPSFVVAVMAVLASLVIFF